MLEDEEKGKIEDKNASHSVPSFKVDKQGNVYQVTENISSDSLASESNFLIESGKLLKVSECFKKKYEGLLHSKTRLNGKLWKPGEDYLTLKSRTVPTRDKEEGDELPSPPHTSLSSHPTSRQSSNALKENNKNEGNGNIMKKYAEREGIDLKRSFEVPCNFGNKNTVQKDDDSFLCEVWGTKKCPGYKQINNWLKKITQKKKAKDKLDRQDLRNEDLDSEDLCGDHHSEGKISFKYDQEPPRSFTLSTFRDAVRYAYYMTFCREKEWRARYVYAEPAIVFRLYLSRYLHSDWSRVNASGILAKTGTSKTDFANQVRPFLGALREGNAINKHSKKDYFSIFRRLKEPDEIKKIEDQLKPPSELRDLNLQECIELWTDKMKYTDLRTGRSLLETPSDSSASDIDSRGNLKPECDQSVSSSQRKFKHTADQAKSTTKNNQSHLDYLQNLNVDLKENDVLLLCLSNKLHYIGVLRFKYVQILIEAANNFGKKWSSYFDADIFEISTTAIPFIKKLLKIKNGQTEFNYNLEKLKSLLENEEPDMKSEGKSSEKLENNEEKKIEMLDVSTYYWLLKENKCIRHIATKKFTLKRLRKYYNIEKQPLPTTKHRPFLRYNKQFDLLIDEREKRAFTVPNIKKERMLSNNEDIQKEIRTRTNSNIIQCGPYILKGCEKVLESCLLAMKSFGIEPENLNQALVFYAQLCLETCENINDNLQNHREIYKKRHEKAVIGKKLSILEEYLKKSQHSSCKSWLPYDEDYYMKTFVSGGKKFNKRYESFFNNGITIEGNINKIINVDDYKFYNITTDYNFHDTDSFNDECGENENSFVDNLCSCGMVKDGYKVDQSKKSNKKKYVQHEFHMEEKETEPNKLDKIRITGFSKDHNECKVPKKLAGKPIEMISKNSVANINKVFDEGLDDFNKNHILNIIEFIKARERGEKPELVLVDAEQTLQDSEMKLEETLEEPISHLSMRTMKSKHSNFAFRHHKDGVTQAKPNPLDSAISLDNFANQSYYVKENVVDSMKKNEVTLVSNSCGNNSSEIITEDNNSEVGVANKSSTQTFSSTMASHFTATTNSKVSKSNRTSVSSSIKNLTISSNENIESSQNLEKDKPVTRLVDRADILLSDGPASAHHSPKTPSTAGKEVQGTKPSFPQPPLVHAYDEPSTSSEVLEGKSETSSSVEHQRPTTCPILQVYHFQSRLNKTVSSYGQEWLIDDSSLIKHSSHLNILPYNKIKSSSEIKGSKGSLKSTTDSSLLFKKPQKSKIDVIEKMKRSKSLSLMTMSSKGNLLSQISLPTLNYVEILFKQRRSHASSRYRPSGFPSILRKQVKHKPHSVMVTNEILTTEPCKRQNNFSNSYTLVSSQLLPMDYLEKTFYHVQKFI